MKKLTLFIVVNLVLFLTITGSPTSLSHASDSESEKRVVQQQIDVLNEEIENAKREERIARALNKQQELRAVEAGVIALDLKARVLQNNYIRLVDRDNGKMTKKLKNGVYFGEVNKKGVMDGVGQATWSNGAKYLGGWQSGKMSGTGKYLFSSGAYYEGEFSDDLFSGQGVFVKQSGEKYAGTFKDDEIVEGTYTKGDISFEGSFKDFKYNGYGKLISDNTIQEGVFSQGELLLGEVTYMAGSMYQGRIINNELTVEVTTLEKGINPK